MPHEKQGNKYIINELELIKWEIEQVYIPVGKSEKRLLPGYLAAISLLNSELEEAKRNGDKDRIRILKKKIKTQNRRNPNYRSPLSSIVVIILFIIFIIALIIFGIWFIKL